MITFNQTTFVIPRASVKDYLLYGFESKGNVVIPPHYQPKSFAGDTLLWVLPVNPTAGDRKSTRLNSSH